MSDTKLSYCDFMNGMCNAPFLPEYCYDCGGNGLKPVYCCEGLRNECGCLGMPVDFVPCECGIKPVTDDQIRRWLADKDIPP